VTTALIISLVVPIAAVAAFLAARGHLPKIATDIRGIALQTVIIIVVLLAIAGAVAGVLLTRGGEVVTELEEADITVNLANIKNATVCAEAGGSWNATTTTCS